jgi:2-methylisocitrate lyase-like PEP mutase family enzyme
VIDTGAVGLNLEDMVEHELLPLDEQLARIRAVRACAASKNVPLVINARTDIFLAQHGDAETRFERSVERLNAYRAAGADCLFAPGVQDRETIGRLVAALSGPLNILATSGSPSITELKQLGVARISLGSGTWRIALEAARRFARELRDTGTFSAVEKAIPYAEMQELLRR